MEKFEVQYLGKKIKVGMLLWVDKKEDYQVTDFFDTVYLKDTCNYLPTDQIDYQLFQDNLIENCDKETLELVARIGNEIDSQTLSKQKFIDLCELNEVSAIFNQDENFPKDFEVNFYIGETMTVTLDNDVLLSEIEEYTFE